MATSKTKEMPIKESYCIYHRRMLPIDNFYVSYNPYHGNKVLPYCADCCNEFVYDKLQSAGNLEAALWLTCAEVGVPFIREVYTRVDNEAKSTDSRVRKSIAEKKYKYFGKYMIALSNKRTKQKFYCNFDETDVALGDVKTLQKSDELIAQQMEELNLTWGKDTNGDPYESEGLSYLEWRYTVYTEGISLTEYQASRYRDLCKAEYDINNGVDVEKATKRKGDAAKDLQINNFVVDKEKTDVQKLIEYDVYIHEKHDPAEFYDQEELYKDYTYTMRDYIKYVARPIRNLIMGSKDYEVTENSKYGDDNDNDSE